MEFNNLNQHKAFIKKEANRLGITPASAYTTYYSRVLLERLALINRGVLLVKGSFSQYVHLKILSRPVLDIDLSSEHFHQIPLHILYQAINDSSDSIVEFDITSIPKQTRNGVYKIPIVAKIHYPGDEKEVIIPIPVDFKENNNDIFETQFKKVEPIFIGDEPFYINTPSFEEHIAEKLYIISHCTRSDVLNTRVKDFYDIYMLHGKDYDPDKFCLYFQAMVMMYGDKLENVSAEFLDKKFINKHEELWQRMQEKYQFLDRELTLDEAVYYVKAVLKEQIQRIRHHEYTDEAIKLVRSKQK